MSTQDKLNTEITAADNVTQPLTKEEEKVDYQQKDDKKDDNSDDVDMSLFRTDKKRMVYTQWNLTRFGDVVNVEQTFQGHFQIDFYWVATYDEKQEWDKHGQNENEWRPEWIPNQTILRLSNAVEIIAWEIMLDTKERDIVLLPRWNKLMWRRRYIIIAKFTESFELEAFPFDTQNFSMTIQAVEHTNLWEFAPLPVPDKNAFVKLKKKFSPLAEWVFETGCIEFYATDPADSFSGKQFSLITCDVKCIRKWSIYFWSMMGPMAVLSLMGLTSFSIELDESPEGRLGYAINIVFTIVAYQFVVQSQLPQISYLTYMDYYVIVSFMYSICLLIQPAVIGTAFADDIDKLHAADLASLIFLVVFWIAIQIFFTIFGLRVKKNENYKLNRSGSEINYGPSVPKEEYETLLINKLNSRKTQFGTVYFHKLVQE